MAEDLFFIRHGQHLSSTNDQPVHEALGLTPVGILEAQALGRQLAVNPETTSAYGFNKARSLGTLALCMYPEASPVEAANIVSDHAAASIYALDELDYMTPPEGTFLDALYASYERNENFLFLVNDSDGYCDQRISSYTVLAGETAKLLKQSTDPAEDRPVNTSPTAALFCPREFYLPCFRAKLGAILHGDTFRDDYVRWYTENIEAKDEARTEIVRVGVIHDNPSGESRLRLKDSYGEMSFTVDALNDLISEYRTFSGAT